MATLSPVAAQWPTGRLVGGITGVDRGGLFAIRLLTSDFSLKYVVAVSSRDMDWWYKIGAMWGGQEGSLLLWALILSICTLVLLIQTRKLQPNELGPWVIVVMCSGTAFFLAMCTLVANVFEPLAEIPQDGQGLNPLLQTPV